MKVAKASSVICSHDQAAKMEKTVDGAFGSRAPGPPSAPRLRIQKRVTTPKLPPPPPATAQARSWWGSSGSRVATTARTSPRSSTVTISTA
ncbi:hypothetical protein SFUMM280S_05519 [Streptomyces fumanus]